MLCGNPGFRISSLEEKGHPSLKLTRGTSKRSLLQVQCRNDCLLLSPSLCSSMKNRLFASTVRIEISSFIYEKFAVLAPSLPR